MSATRGGRGWPNLPAALGFNDIDQVVNRGIASNGNVCRVDSILTHDGLDLVVVNVSQRHCAGYVQPALVLLPESDVWRLLVTPDAEALQLGLDDPLVRQRLVHIEHNEDEMTGLCNGDDLATSAATVFGALDDTG